MTGARSRKEFKKYKLHRKNNTSSICDLCNISENDNRVVYQTNNFQVIKNKYPYSVWDSVSVSDHLMIIPTKHIDNLGALTDKEKIEFVDLVVKYENMGYNIYARSPKSIVKSITHQHTHLIKPTGKMKKIFIMSRFPYFIISR